MFIVLLSVVYHQKSTMLSSFSRHDWFRNSLFIAGMVTVMAVSMAMEMAMAEEDDAAAGGLYYRPTGHIAAANAYVHHPLVAHRHGVAHGHSGNYGRGHLNAHSHNNIVGKNRILGQKIAQRRALDNIAAKKAYAADLLAAEDRMSIAAQAISISISISIAIPTANPIAISFAIAIAIAIAIPIPGGYLRKKRERIYKRDAYEEEKRWGRKRLAARVRAGSLYGRNRRNANHDQAHLNAAQLYLAKQAAARQAAYGRGHHHHRGLRYGDGKRHGLIYGRNGGAVKAVPIGHVRPYY